MATMDRGEWMVRFINRLKHTGDYFGQPFRLRPWQEQFTRDLFGTIRPDGLRQYRRAFYALPRKQGKTEQIAAIADGLLFEPGKQGQRIYSASGSRDQASLIFKAAASMIRQDEYLSTLCTIYDSYRRIVVHKTDNVFEALASEAGLRHGLGPSAVLFDELHVLPDRELFNVLTSGFGARREPLTLMITTAGHDRHSLCYEQWDYARKVRDGIIEDPTFLPVLYEAAPEDDWTDEKVWRKCMPALGDYCSIEFIRDECRRAKELPVYENTFRQLYLNQWTAQAVRWLSMDKWRACGGPVDEDALRGQPCYAGLDLSTTTDLSALVLAFPASDGGYDVLTHAWVPEEAAEIRERRDKVPYRQWAKQGFLTLTPGPTVDYSYIESFILQTCEQYQVKRLFADPYNATQLCQSLLGQGVPVEFLRQGFMSLSGPTKEFERLVLAGKLRHGDHPVLAWCADNVVVEVDAAGNIKPSKRKSTERIDCVAALVNALGAAMAEREEASVYESRGLLVI
jgi:phage terminase large subunit-like protein